MFAFSHPETEQMKATTDYRYIGNIPNNYVFFNCDSVNNQSASTCEIWRIIGVFEVDDGTGNYEQRIKLVRGSAFATTMSWDDDRNNWPDTNLNTFLNEDYLNRENAAISYGLKDIAQSQIADAKYYLGGRKFANGANYGSTEDFYDLERGNIVYNWYGEANSTSWTGTVGLIYPSDYGYTYSNGIEEVCYGDLRQCYEENSLNTSGSGIAAYPNSGWIYNSNNLEGQTSLISTWFLNPYSDLVFAVNSEGRVIFDHLNKLYAVRPVVYLKSSIQITGGDGSENNPYTLSS